jgi:formyltetrahydrofolate deformylase
LLVSCRDRTGLVAALSEFVFENGGNILDADQHADRETGLFFMRLVWDLGSFKLARAEIAGALDRMARPFDLRWEITYSDERKRVAILASKTPHCLYDLLLAHQLGELGGDLAVVVSNHDELASVAGHFGVPFQHIPVDPRDKAAAEAEQQRLLAAQRIDLVVLARYMQVLSAPFVQRWEGRIINIHHSFLPAFIGARPYHQAKERGVKVIGATAHYVTSELDQGPIIEQDVCRVSHRDDVDDMIRKGRELERQVLTRAVRAHLERRVLISGNRTIVFG